MQGHVAGVGVGWVAELGPNRIFQVLPLNFWQPSFVNRIPAEWRGGADTWPQVCPCIVTEEMNWAAS